MIRVCDAIMGSGKTTATIAYMNAHKDDKFIYITPYLDEAARIKEGCPELNFVEPCVIREYRNRKSIHTAALIKEGANITTTHQAFKMYTPEMKEDIRNQGYTLFIDENVDMLAKVNTDPGDIQLAIDAGYIKQVDDEYVLVKEYKGSALSDMCEAMETRSMTRCSDGKGAFFWRLPADLISCFKDVFVLTYLFEGQSLYYMFQMYNLEYEKIGIRKTEDGKLVFGDFQEYIPEYVSHLNDMIDIYEGKLNDIGNNRSAISKAWMTRGTKSQNMKTLKNHMYNYFRHICSDAGAAHRLWSTHKQYYEKLKGRGYSNAFIPFNTKATNAYRDKDVLAYAINVYMNVEEKSYYNAHDIEVDEDMFALSIMVQWIWRSAIRDGKKIRIYIPSSRMREILKDWINNLTNGGNQNGREEV